MAYRDADPPTPTREQAAVRKLAETGRRLKQGQAIEARAAELAQQAEQEAGAIAVRNSRLRILGRRAHPSMGTLAAATLVLSGIALGLYLLSMTSWDGGVWAAILLWATVFLVPPGILLERAIAKRNGLSYEARARNWIAGLPFAVEAQPWWTYDKHTTVKLEVHFKGGKPEPQVLEDVLRPANTAVAVQVVGVMSSDLAKTIALTDSEALGTLIAPRGGMVLAMRHRERYAEYWLGQWLQRAVESFKTIHEAYPIQRLRLLK